MILVFVYLLATVLFLALLLSLGVQPKLITRLTGVILFVTGVLGTALYGYAYSVLFPSVPQAVIRTLFSVFCMFLGRNEIGAISAVPALQTPGMQLLIYAVHLMALYTTASAMAASVGARLIRRLHLFLARRGKLRLIFGGGDEALAFAAGLEKTGGVNVFVGRDAALDGLPEHFKAFIGLLRAAGLDVKVKNYKQKDLYTTRYVIWDNIGLPKKDRDIYSYQSGAITSALPGQWPKILRGSVRCASRRPSPSFWRTSLTARRFRQGRADTALVRCWPCRAQSSQPG